MNSLQNEFAVAKKALYYHGACVSVRFFEKAGDLSDRKPSLLRISGNTVFIWSVRFNPLSSLASGAHATRKVALLGLHFPEKGHELYQRDLISTNKNRKSSRMNQSVQNQSKESLYETADCRLHYAPIITSWDHLTYKATAQHLSNYKATTSYKLRTTL